MATKAETTQATEGLRLALEEALASGLTHGDITTLVATAINNSGDVGCQAPLPNLPTNGKPKVYRELPEGLIDLPSAAQKYGINRYTLHAWVRKGHIRSFGRLRGRAHGGGFIILDESEVLAYRDCPRHPGRRKAKIE